MVWHQTIDPVSHELDLSHSAASKQSQMHDKAMHLPPMNIDPSMQQATLLHAMVGDVLIFKTQDGKT